MNNYNLIIHKNQDLPNNYILVMENHDTVAELNTSAFDLIDLNTKDNAIITLVLIEGIEDNYYTKQALNFVLHYIKDNIDIFHNFEDIIKVKYAFNHLHTRISDIFSFKDEDGGIKVLLLTLRAHEYFAIKVGNMSLNINDQEKFPFKVPYFNYLGSHIITKGFDASEIVSDSILTNKTIIIKNKSVTITINN